MNLINFIKNKFKKIIINFSNKFNVTLSKLSSFEKKLIILNTLNIDKRLKFANELSKEYPDNPRVQLALVECMHDSCDTNFIKQSNLYLKTYNNWIKKNGLDKLDVEFILPAIFSGSLGNHFCVFNILLANKYGLRKTKKLILLLRKNNKLRNKALFEYFEPYIQVIKDEYVINSLEKLEKTFTIPWGLTTPLKEICAPFDLACNYSEIEREKINDQDKPFFTLNNQHKKIGEDNLRKLGLPNNAWYVTLHVRESGYRHNDHKTERWRNANILDYVKAIKEITDKGGWVFRMGDSSMSNLPKMHQVIDYAHSSMKSETMDVFLGATCKFCIATSSGYYVIPSFFNVPILFTNSPRLIELYGLRKNDIYLPRLYKNKIENRIFSFKEQLTPPQSLYWLNDHFDKNNIELIINTAEEIEIATREMLESIFNKYNNEDVNQKKFKDLVNKLGLLYGNKPTKIYASISRSFINKYFILLGDK